MYFTVSLDQMLVGGALALIGASMLAGAIVWCVVYVITAVVHGLVRVARRRREERRPDAEEHDTHPFLNSDFKHKEK